MAHTAPEKSPIPNNIEAVVKLEHQLLPSGADGRKRWHIQLAGLRAVSPLLSPFSLVYALVPDQYRSSIPATAFRLVPVRPFIDGCFSGESR
jgi:hypothetical protein